MDVKRLARILRSKNDLIINEVVLNKVAKDKQIIYGARAYNYQSPDNLRKKTYDYDILTKKPRKAAYEVSKELSRRLGEKVDVVKALHKGTYRVKLGDDVLVDYTQMKKKPKTKKVWGTYVKSLKSIKGDAQRLVRDPKAEFRREKDLDTLDRIRQIEDLEERFNI